MIRWIMLVMIAVLFGTVNANDFFGIPILAEPKDDIAWASAAS